MAAPGLRRITLRLGFVIVPLTVPLFGYFPGRLLRLPLLSISFTDDGYLSERNIASLQDRQVGTRLRDG